MGVGEWFALCMAKAYLDKRDVDAEGLGNNYDDLGAFGEVAGFPKDGTGDDAVPYADLDAWIDGAGSSKATQSGLIFEIKCMADDKAAKIAASLAAAATAVF